MTTVPSAIYQIRNQLDAIADATDRLFDAEDADAVDEIIDATGEIHRHLDTIDPEANDDMFYALLDVHRVAVLAVERGDLSELADMLRDDALRALFDRWHRLMEGEV